jgi:hypothetical protein
MPISTISVGTAYCVDPLGGPAALHGIDVQQGSSHALVERNIRQVQEALGHGSVSALMTATKES